MRKIIYGTNNPAKLEMMRACLAPLGIEIIGLNETGVTIPEADENGKTPLENARIKAAAYYKALKRPVFACDSGLYIEGLPEDEQPGVHVRTVNGKRLSDGEMTEYYAGIASKLGGKAIARYKNAICLILNDNEIYEHFGDDISGEAFYLTDKPHPKRNEGFPLDCISIHIASGEYYYNRPAETDTGVMASGFQNFFMKTLTSRNGHKIMLELLNNKFPIHFIKIEQLREAGSDSYAVFSNDNKYFLRVIKPAFFDTAEAGADIQIFLQSRNFPVPAILLTNDGASHFKEDNKLYAALFDASDDNGNLRKRLPK